MKICDEKTPREVFCHVEWSFHFIPKNLSKEAFPDTCPYAMSLFFGYEGSNPEILPHILGTLHRHILLFAITVIRACYCKNLKNLFHICLGSDSQEIFRAQFIGIIIVCMHTKFHISRYKQ